MKYIVSFRGDLSCLKGMKPSNDNIAQILMGKCTGDPKYKDLEVLYKFPSEGDRKFRRMP